MSLLSYWVIEVFCVLNVFTIRIMNIYACFVSQLNVVIKFSEYLCMFCVSIECLYNHIWYLNVFFVSKLNVFTIVFVNTYVCFVSQLNIFTIIFDNQFECLNHICQ